MKTGTFDNITGHETYGDMIAGHNENIRQANKYLFIKLSHQNKVNKTL